MPNAVSSWRVSFFSTKGSNALQIYNFIVKRQCTEKGKRVIVEPVRNKQNKIYGIRFQYEGQTFKASEIGKEFGLRSLFHHYGQSIDERPIQPKHFEKSHFDNMQIGSGLLSGLASVTTPEANLGEYDDALPVWKAEKMRKKKRKIRPRI
jgi:hypothetical protein